jgi:putative SOS response-associated peptidase YedK
VCNLYSSLTPQEAMRRVFPGLVDLTGNMPPLPGVYPDHEAPVVRSSGDDRELVMARWGLPSPPRVLEGKARDPGVTNVRNAGSPHWRRWLGPEHRCVVPVTSFAEPFRRPDGRSEQVWFAADETRPLMWFAGLWVRWTSVRKVKLGVETVDAFAILTCAPNREVREVHPKAMPVLLGPSDLEQWLTAPIAAALKLQRPLPDGALRIVARGEKEDRGAPAGGMFEGDRSPG